ncbi:hypothetical protein B5P45_18785 [Phyllobacterium zundukense]|uniref:Uncharacterized protein n=1 Tax=Phyllobacterium zundukense TaxID=1867719 RepID=A0A2N9VUW2_9HYPH|nr:hypothetical protein B5P45_18785 [Phyllobacterium zundukense]
MQDKALLPSPLWGGTEQSSGEGFLHEFNHFQKKPRQLIQHLQTSFILLPSFPRGTASGAVRSGDRIGASDGG